ncbi:MAG TPA: hypothetical protein VFM88_07055 [Vicinamibacteria bacterium]|nr:hypothetical protein [Vicinamibacteria bacterium]
MSRVPSLRVLCAIISVVLASAPGSARAQAFTPPDGVGAITLAWQYVDNTGHRFSDGYFEPGFSDESVTTSGLLETEYAISGRLAATLGVPYVFAKYTGQGPSFSGLPRDECRCWHSEFADFGASLRYRLGSDTWAVTPAVRFVLPSHAYPYRGEAVVGKRLAEWQVGVFIGWRLVNLWPAATLQAGYTYAFVEQPLDDISIDRSNLFADLGYAVNRRVYLRVAWLGQHTHGGLRIGSPSGNPFPFPGEFTTPLSLTQVDRVLRSHYMQVAGGASFDAGPVDIFVSYTKYVWGRDAHNGQVFGGGVTWYFGMPE